MKQICTINNLTNKKVKFFSLAEAERNTGISHSRISGCCNKKYEFKSAGSFTWKFAKTKRYEKS